MQETKEKLATFPERARNLAHTAEALWRIVEELTRIGRAVEAEAEAMKLAALRFEKRRAVEAAQQKGR
jgi:hypothetical protein